MNSRVAHGRMTLPRAVGPQRVRALFLFPCANLLDVVSQLPSILMATDAKHHDSIQSRRVTLSKPPFATMPTEQPIRHSLGRGAWLAVHGLFDIGLLLERDRHKRQRAAALLTVIDQHSQAPTRSRPESGEPHRRTAALARARGPPGMDMATPRGSQPEQEANPSDRCQKPR